MNFIPNFVGTARYCADLIKIVMKKIIYLFLFTVFAFSIQAITPAPANAQCAMCSLTAQNATENGNVQGKGLNNGILFLLAMPYLAAVGIGALWYVRYRSKKNVRFDEGPIRLN